MYGKDRDGDDAGDAEDKFYPSETMRPSLYTLPRAHDVPRDGDCKEVAEYPTHEDIPSEYVTTWQCKEGRSPRPWRKP